MGGPRGKKKVDSAKMEQYKEICPAHKLKDLDALVKSLKGKDAEITKRIQEWWDEKDEEPTPAEPEWVEAKSAKKKHQQQQQQLQSSRTSGRGSGRGGRGSYRGGGGRGSGPSDRRSRSRRSSPPSKSPQPQDEHSNKHAAAVEVNGSTAHDVPAPVVNATAPKGAWGNRGVAQPAQEPALAPPSPAAAPVIPLKPEPISDKPVVDVGVVAPQDPTPSGLSAATSPVRTAAASTSSGGNVWATKGSAHLIQAEKPKPPPPTPPRQAVRLPPQHTEPPKSPAKQSLEPVPEPPLAPPPLDSGLSSTLPGMNAGNWNTGSAPPLEMTQSSSSVAEATLSSIGAPEVSVVPEPSPAMSPAKPPPAPPAPTNVLNMGHWESGEGDDSQNLDFGFGSFGPESSTVEEPASPARAPMAASTDASSAMSPARPPPGLSIGGMPPMPANAVLVHELEGKLESATLGKAEEQAEGPKPMTSNLPSVAPTPANSHPAAPSAPPGVMSQNYNTAYAGMYNYTNAAQPSGFMGAPAGLGMPPQQKPQTGIPGPQQAPLSGGGIPQHLQQQPPPPAGLYGAPAPTAGAPGGENSTGPSSTENSTTGLPPPGMPNAMAYANPALFYQQQPYQMGQPHGGVGYGYGYGAQFGGAAGFAYGQQVMGQSGGYPYDDQPPPGRNDYPSKGNNRYNRNSGNQYQNQFNPQQHGGYGYGGQPMGGYNIDHFNQRGGYGHGPPPTDHYGMPQQQGSSNYSGDKKGGRFQPQHQQLGGGGGGGGGQDHQQLQQQQPHSAFLGGGTDTSSSNNHHQGASGGWSNNNNTNSSNQGGGWGQPSAWQGGN